MWFDVNLIAPCIICFMVGALISLLDVHRFITEQGNGTAPIPYTMAWETNLFFICIGLLSVTFFALSLVEPKGWIDTTLAVNTDNFIYRALLIGATTNILIRTKLLEIGGNKIGFEYIYDIFRNWSVNAYKATASRKKMSIAHELAPKTVGIGSFEYDLKAMVKDTINHRGKDIAYKLAAELESVAALKASSETVRYNEILIRIAIDFSNIRSIEKCVKTNSKLP